MPLLAWTRAPLVAALALLVPLAVAAHADAPLAASGPYTLTQSQVDADAAYLGWAAGRTLTPAERQRLAALDVARFRRDPAWTVKALDGEQKNLPFFQTQPAPFQDRLRRTVIEDIPDARANRLTPDEARQMQQIVSGVGAVATGPAADATQQTTPRRTLAQADTRMPLHDGRYTLTQGMLNDTLEFWQIILGRPLSRADRQAMTAVDVDRFRHDPASLTALLRGVHASLPQVRRLNAVDVASLRQINLVDIYCTPQALRLTPDEAAGMQAVVSRNLPIVGVDAAGRTVITGRDIDAWVAATRFVTAQARVPGPGPDYRPSLVQMSHTPATMGVRVAAEAADMDRNWTAFRLVWPRLSAAQRAQVMAPRLAVVRKAAARKQNLTMAAVESMDLCRQEFEDYSTAMDPRLASGRGGIAQQMRFSRFQQNMMNYNIQMLRRGEHNYSRQLKGEDPDLSDPLNNLRLPVP